MLCTLVVANCDANADEKRRTEITRVNSKLYKTWLKSSESMLQKLSAAKNPHQRLTAIDEFQIAGVILGANGEVFLRKPGDSEPFGPTESWAVLAKSKISIVTYRDDDLVPLIIVDKKLQMHPTEHCTKQFSESFMPTKWPSVDRNGDPVAVTRAYIVLPKSYTQSELRLWRGSKPAGSMAAFFLDVSGNLRGICQNEPFPNVIWVVRRGDGGLDFIHSGPAKSGKYIEVAADGLVQFIDPEAVSWTGSKEGVRWTVWDPKTSLPAVYSCHWRIIDAGTDKTWVDDSGQPYLISIKE